MSLLDGKNDLPHPDANTEESSRFKVVIMVVYSGICTINILQIQKTRFENNKRNRAVANMKIKALKVMDLFFNFRLYLRLQVCK